MSTYSKSLRQAFGWSLVQHWGARCISFVVFFVLARLLTPGDFGLVALSSIVIAFTEIFIDQGFSDAIVQSHDDSEQYLSTAFWVNIVTAVALMVVVFAGSNLLATLFKAPKLATITRVLSITFLFTALSSVQIALLRRKMDYRSLAVRTSVANIVSGIVAIAMAFLRFGVWSLVIQQVVYGLVSLVVVWRVGAFRPSLYVDRKSFQQLMHFGLKVCGIRTVDLLHTRLIDSLVGVYLGAIVLGIYSIGTRLAVILMQLLGTSVADVSLSHFSELRRTDGDIAGAYLKMVRRIAFTSVPVFAFLTLESRPIVHIVFGQKWDDASPVFAAFCGVGIVQVALYFSYSALTAAGRPGLQFVLGIIKLALYVVGFYIFLPRGITAIAWSTTAITVFMIAPLSLIILERIIHFSMIRLFRELWLPYSCVLISSLITYGVGRNLAPLSWARLIVSTAVFFSSFVTLSMMVDPEIKVLSRRMLARLR